jgi:flavin-dependent dehydrogenase
VVSAAATDLFVIGGGPAGLAAAIAARLRGLSVRLADGRVPPVDKACGEGIMPDGVHLLRCLGVAIPAEDSYPFRGIRYVQEGRAAEARFRRGERGLAVRRTVLHDALRRRAEELDVQLSWGTPVSGLHPEGVLVEGRLVACRWVAAADGLESRARREAGLDRPARHRRFGLRRRVAVPAWTDLVEVHWSEGCEAYVTPVSSRETCMAILTDDPSPGMGELLARFPALHARLRGAAPTCPDRGAATVARRLPCVVTERLALVGDASGCVDAITGEGVTLALHQAMALARALAAGRLESYAADHRRIMRVAERMGRLMLAIHHRPRLRRLAIASLSRAPAVFSQLLAIHTRSHPLLARRAEGHP